MSGKPRVAIITARNLKTTSDCSPETILNLLNVIDVSKYEVDIVYIDAFVPEELRVDEAKLLNLPMYVPFSEVEKHPRITQVRDLSDLKFTDLKENYQIAIVAVYNDFGEDGKILGMLDLLGIPYMSPSLKVSAVCFDKSYTKALLCYAGVSTPRGFLINHNNCREDLIDGVVAEKLSYPVMLKSVSSGNSWGVSKVINRAGLSEAISHALAYSDEILLEEFVDGQEFTVGVVGDYTNPTILPVVQINHQHDYFDYVAKYTKGKSNELCPSPISQDLEAKLRLIAKEAYKAVKADSHARIDIMLDKDEAPYVLDINTFPGLNKASLFPKELLVCGSSLGEFVNNELATKYRRD